MTIRDLEIFNEVYRTLSITKASNNLQISQPSVSQVIRSLETEFNIQLFSRSSNRLIKTTATDQFYQYSTHITETIAQTLFSMNSLHAKENVRIGCTPTIGSFHMPLLASKIKQLFPSLNLSIVVDNHSKLMHGMEMNQIHFSLIEGTPLDKRIFHNTLWGADNLAVAFPLKYPSSYSLRILSEELPLITRETESSSYIYLKNLFHLYDIPFIPQIICNSNEAIVNMIASNIGYSVIPLEYITNSPFSSNIQIADQNLVSVSRSFYIAYTKNMQFSETVQSILNLLIDYGKTLLK